MGALRLSAVQLRVALLATVCLALGMLARMVVEAHRGLTSLRAQAAAQGGGLAASVPLRKDRWPPELQGRSGWLPDLRVHLVDTLFFNETSFMLLGFLAEHIVRAEGIAKLVRRDAVDLLPPEAGPLTEVQDPLEVMRLFGPRAPKCQQVPTASLQSGDNAVGLFVCHQPHGGPWHLTQSPAWRFSQRRRQARPAAASRAAGGGRLSLSTVAAVTSFTPHAAELVRHAWNTRVEHVYLGLCVQTQSEHWTSYREALGPWIRAGFVSLFQVGKVAFEPREKFRDFETIETCRVPAYQMALYHAKRHGDRFQLVSDFDELLIPMPQGSSLAVRPPPDVGAALGEAIRASGLAEADICYVRVHGDEVSKPVADATAPLTARFPRRCDCSPLPALADRDVSNVGGSCGVAYMKSIANVATTFFTSVHAHSACTAHGGVYYMRRPHDDPPARPWAPPEVLRLHHFVDMWKPRHYKRCNAATGSKLVPAEFVDMQASNVRLPPWET